MKRVASIHVYWGDKYGKPPKTLAEKIRDEKLAQEILQKIKGMRNVKVAEEGPNYCDLKITGDESFRAVMEILQTASHLVGYSRAWKTYSRQELQAAPLLEWRLTNQAIEDDYYTLHFKEGQAKGIAPYARDCPSCRAHLEQVRDIWVDTRKMGQRDLSLTYSFEIILSARLARMLQEAGFTGFALRPVWDYRKPYQGEPQLYQLVVTNVLPPMASPPTEFEQAQRCEVCGTQTQYLKHTHFWGRIQYYEETDIYYAREVLEQATDFNATYERIGGLPDGHPLVLISQRVYRWLKEQGIKGWSARPVYLVGSSTLTSE
jgi:hypothetical protein